ncbi:MAG: glyoxylase-like metal-dependent hydrolase (beta-lactamase superfamily II) [Alteromonadaceae bacterium]|jgi:glyoxylase-like metal-dependent hydrolase (beta-lactamase superfamily II)
MSDQKTYFQQLKLGALALLLFNFSPVLFASEKENSIINKTIAAYGGDKLMKLKSLQFTDKMSSYSPWQSGHSAQGPMVMYLNKYQIELTIDLLNKKKVFKEVTTRLIGGHTTDTPAVAHRIFVEGKGYEVDHALKKYQPVKYLNYDNVDSGNSQLLDPIIVRQLDKSRDNVQWTDTANIQGQAHDVLSVNAGTKQEYIIYINQKSGYLTRMLKTRGQKIRSYDFLDHSQTQGITWAKELFVSTAEQPIYHTDSRKFSFNSAQDHQFNISTGYKPQTKKQYFDVSQLTIRQVAKDVYFVGQGWGYTLFIDAGDHYISAGAWGEKDDSPVWQQGLDLLRKTTGNNKPVTQHLVSHHHTDHMSGLRNIVKQGANLIIHPTNIAAVNEYLKQPLADNRFVSIEKTSYLADGKVMLFDVPNGHASHNIVIYLPEYKLLLTEDMFGSSYQTELDSPLSWPNVDVYPRLELLNDAINQLNLEVEQYLSTHHGRILNQTEIDEALTLNRPSKEEVVKRLFSNNTELN